LRILNSPAPREPRPRRLRRGSGDAVCGSFLPAPAPVCPAAPAVPWSDDVAGLVADVPWSELLGLEVLGEALWSVLLGLEVDGLVLLGDVL